MVGDLSPGGRQFPVVGMWGQEIAGELWRTKILVIKTMIESIVWQELPLSHIHIYRAGLLHPLTSISVLEESWKMD